MTEQEQIKEAFEDLLKSLRKETSKENRQKIKEAFEFANEAHKGVKRRSGEPYILHPLAVAKIAVKEIGLGTTSVISALLHDPDAGRLCPGDPDQDCRPFAQYAYAGFYARA